MTSGRGLSVDGALVSRVGLFTNSAPYSSVLAVFVDAVAVLVPPAAPRGLALLASGLGGWLAAEGNAGKRPGWSGEVPLLAVSGRGELGREPWTGLRRGLDGEADTWRPLANVGLTGGPLPKMGEVAAVAVEPDEQTDECCERLPRPLRVPVELRASGEMAEQRRRECSPIESLRSLRRSRRAWLSSTVCDWSDESSDGLTPCSYFVTSAHFSIVFFKRTKQSRFTFINHFEQSLDVFVKLANSEQPRKIRLILSDGKQLPR